MQKEGKNNMTKLQKIQLSILKNLTKILEANYIPYFLAYGSTLGAVRHQGFIPWDDDIDIFIYAKDYEKLRNIFSRTDTGDLEFHDYSTKKGYPYVFPKVIDKTTELKENTFSHLDYMCGVYVDIFPIFEVSDNRIFYWADCIKTYIQYGIVKAYYTKPKHGVRMILHKISSILFNPIKAQTRLFNRYTNMEIKGNYVKEPNMFSRDQLIKKEYFEESIIVDFEDLRVPIFSKFDSYLTDAYGDYMKIPPENKRVSAHNIIHLKIEKDEDDNE